MFPQKETTIPKFSMLGKDSSMHLNEDLKDCKSVLYFQPIRTKEGCYKKEATLTVIQLIISPV